MLKQANEAEDVSPNAPKGGYWDAYSWIKDADGYVIAFGQHYEA